ncbi:MAG: hypothetical protein AB1813_28835 [Verrucomicrobiota bacterium]
MNFTLIPQKWWAHRSLAYSFPAIALVLFALVIREVNRGEMLAPDAVASPVATRPAYALNKLDTLVSIAPPVNAVLGTNALHPFFTTFYQPAPAPKPTTRTIELVYSGYTQVADGARQAFVKVGPALKVAAPGAKLVSDLAIAEVSLKALILTNAAGQTNRLEFNVKKQIEIPL